MLVVSLFVQILAPLLPAPMLAAPLPRPNDRDQQLPAKVTPAAGITQNAAPAAVKEDTTLAASLFLHLDREVLVVGETALLTATVRSKFVQEVARRFGRVATQPEL